MSAAPLPVTHAGAAPPYALDPIVFPLPALAAACGATDGTAAALATGAFLVARLALGMLPPLALATSERRIRADRARATLGALAVPQPARMALLRASDATAADGATAAAAMHELAALAAGHLASAALAELETLGERVRLYFESTASMPSAPAAPSSF